ncbi:MAG: hypothetical protein FIB08_17460 [Candidatus Methanoperedens sp.]|nr:hypothetical protein [Candidatus Methanoperedens sp.]
MEKEYSYSLYETPGGNSSTGQVRWSSSPLDKGGGLRGGRKPPTSVVGIVKPLEYTQEPLS